MSSDGSAAGPPARRRRGWPLRLAIGVLEGVAALAGLAMLAVALLALRLAWGPLAVDWLAPALTQALDAAADPLTVTIAGASVTWGTGRPTVDLIARDLHLRDQAGLDVLTLPSLEISLSARELLDLHLVPTRLIATRPRLHLVRAATGRIGVVPAGTPQPDAEPEAAGETIEPWPQMLRALAGKPSPGDPLGQLDSVSLVDMEAEVEDRQTGLDWHLAGGTASATRSATGLAIRVAGRLVLGAAETAVNATLQLDTTQRIATLDAGFTRFDPAGLAAALPASLQGLAAVRFGVAGRLNAALDIGTMRLGRASFSLHGSPGEIVDPRLPGGRIGLQSADLEAAYDPAIDRLDLSRLALDFGGTTIEASGTVDPAGPQPLIGAAGPGQAKARGRLILRNLPLDRFAALWPQGVAGDARSWIIENLSVGKVDELKLDADAAFDPAAADPVSLTRFAGTLAVSNGTVDYLAGLPRLEGVDATIALSPQKLDFVVTAGRMQGNGLTVPRGTITIDGFDEPVQRITLDLGLRGPASDVMAVLDVKRLQYARAIGLAPDRIAGSVDGTLHFRFRLKKDLPFSEVEYGATASLANLAITRAALGQDLTEGGFDLVLDHDHVALDGLGRLGGVPAKIAWTQRIGGTAGPRSQVHVVARLDQAARRRFDVDLLPDIVRGPVDADIGYRVADEHQAAATVALDLAPSDLAIDLAGWAKPSGPDADAHFRVEFQDGTVTRIAELTAHAPGLTLAGGLDFRDGRVSRATIDRFVAGPTDLAGSVDHGPTGPWMVKLRGPSLDFEPVRKQLTGGPDAAPGDDGPALDLDIAADRVLNGPDRVLRQLAFKGAVARHTLLHAQLAARIGTAGKLDFHLDPVESRGGFAIETDDFGALFKIAGITDNLVGGHLALTGTSRLEGAGRRFTGKVEGRDYRITNTPFLTRLLSLASFQTMLSLLSGDGIPFSTLKADLSLKQGVLEIRNGHAYGAALGVTADGWIDTRALTLQLEGKLVPANLLNSAFSNVPVLGPLLIGPSGSGLFAANVRVCDRLAEPTVSVNPLSVLAPGIFKELPPFGPLGSACRPMPEPTRPN